MVMIYRKFKQLFKPPGMDPKHGIKKTYKNLFCGIRKILNGEIRIDYRTGKTEFHPLYPYKSNLPNKFKHNFAIAAIVKNESRYLQEWIEFHRLIGCSKFFIYDNGSTDNTIQILNYYHDKGILDWIEWPHMNSWLNSQQTAYCHAIYKTRGYVRWLALIDADEFLFSPYPQDFVSFLNGYIDLPALIVYWDMFNTSGHQNYKEGLLIENYTNRLDVSNPENKYQPLCKSIVQPHRINAVSNAHCFQTNLWPVLGFDENRRPIFSVNKIHPQNRIKLNHYYTKSKEEWKARMESNSGAARGFQKPDSSSFRLRRMEQIFNNIHRFEVKDTTCHFLLKDLKNKIATNKIDLRSC